MFTYLQATCDVSKTITTKLIYTEVWVFLVSRDLFFLISRVSIQIR